MRFGPLLGLKPILWSGDENVTKGDVLVELNMRSYIPEARLRVKVSFYKNQMVAVTCGHSYPFVIAYWVEQLLSTLLVTSRLEKTDRTNTK
jgi:hypothetical protein